MQMDLGCIAQYESKSEPVGSIPPWFCFSSCLSSALISFNGWPVTWKYKLKKNPFLSKLLVVTVIITAVE